MVAVYFYSEKVFLGLHHSLIMFTTIFFFEEF